MHKVAAVVAVVLLATAVWAWDIQTLMTGDAQIAGPTLAEAWAQNPATLGSFAGCAAANDGDALTGRVSGIYGLNGMTDLIAVTAGAIPAGAKYGVGAGFMDGMGATNVGVGLGTTFGKSLSAGASYRNTDPDAPGAASMDSLDLALAGGLGSLFGSSGISWGLVARDVLDEVQTTFDGGLQLITGGWRLAVDVNDFTDEIDTAVQYGVSRAFGTGDRWLLGAGSNDGDATAGAAYAVNDPDAGKTWTIGVGWQEVDGADDMWILGMCTAL